MVFNEEGPPGRGGPSETILINPEIVARSRKTDIDEEGCLSFPKIYADVEVSPGARVPFIPFVALPPTCLAFLWFLSHPFFPSLLFLLVFPARFSFPAIPLLTFPPSFPTFPSFPSILPLPALPSLLPPFLLCPFNHFFPAPPSLPF